MSENSEITLVSSENKQFKIAEKAAVRSKLIQGILTDYEKGEDLPLPEVNSETLETVIKYLEHYVNDEPKEIPKPLKDGDLSKILEPWDYEYISKVSLENSIKLVNAANYMDIGSLLQLSCCRIASEMVDRPVDEVQKLFGIECDMTEEEMKEYDKYPID
jgi:S-phase kinase-associated protein 1